jgi:phospholipase A1/A2
MLPAKNTWVGARTPVRGGGHTTGCGEPARDGRYPWMNSLPQRRVLCAALCLAAHSAGSAFAQAQPSALVQCHAIESVMDRLACYDRVSGRESTPSAPPKAPVQPTTDAIRAAREPETDSASYLERTWGLARNAPRVGVSAYRTNYLLIARYSDNPNDNPFSPTLGYAGSAAQELNPTEAKFQISAKLRLWANNDRRWSLYGAYTQQSQWQVYSPDISRPFRETNYMPEAFITFAPRLSFAGFDWRLLSAGATHQSNGRSDPLSRSWNRLFVEAGIEHDQLAIFARGWYRLPEDEHDDNNPDITDYYGYGELRASYRWGENALGGWVRGNFTTGKGAAELSWVSPPVIGPLRGYVQLFTGYGESLIDYNWRQTTIGVGFALNDGP